MSDEVRSVSSTGGEKGVKPEAHDLIPVEALAEIARVYGEGARKYSRHNWRRGYEWSKSYAAAQRHLQAFWGGEDRDPELGTLHLGNAIFHLMGLIVFMAEHPEFDDRYKAAPDEPEPVVTGELVRLTKSGYSVITAQRTSDGRLYERDSNLLYTVEEWAELGWVVA